MKTSKGVIHDQGKEELVVEASLMISFVESGFLS